MVEGNERSGSGGDVEIVSGSYAQINRGFEMALAQAEIASKKWAEKKEQSGKEYLCNGCGKKFKTLAGVKKHMSSKKCNTEKGYKEITSAKITGEDRKLSGQDDVLAEKLKKMAEFSKKQNQVLSASNVNGKAITAEDLVKCPTQRLEELLKKAPTEEVSKFSLMRFHPANASRKYLADRELSKRK